MRKTISIVILIGILFISCSNDSESDLMEPETMSDLTYEGSIKQIMNTNCLGCHSAPPVNGAPFSLNTYERVKDRTENGNLIRAINRQTGESAAMPPSGRMPQATIDMIEQWADEGFLEQ